MEVINFEYRNLHSNLNQLRKEGTIPGSLYGPSINSDIIKMKASEFRKAISKKMSIYRVKSKGKSIFVRFGEIQKDPATNKVLHFSLVQVPDGVNSEMDVPVEFRGIPKGSKTGGLLVVIKNKVRVKGLPKNIPERIQFDVSSLSIGEKVLVQDLMISAKLKSADKMDQILAVLQAPSKKEEVLRSEEEDDAHVEVYQ